MQWSLCEKDEGIIDRNFRIEPPAPAIVRATEVTDPTARLEHTHCIFSSGLCVPYFKVTRDEVARETLVESGLRLAAKPGPGSNAAGARCCSGSVGLR